MKKIIYAFAGVLALLSFSSCSMFKYDVLDGPNAQINGCLLDVQTGEKIGIEYYSGTSAPGMLIVVEHGWDSEAEQGWLVRFDGMYTNNLIFAGSPASTASSPSGFLATSRRTTPSPPSPERTGWTFPCFLSAGS